MCKTVINAGISMFIITMKWTMSTLARPGPMALVEDGVLFGFIATKLMAQDASLVEESVVDDEFATFL